MLQKTGRKGKRLKVCRFHRLGGEGEGGERGERGEGGGGERGDGRETAERHLSTNITLLLHPGSYKYIVLVGIGCMVGIQHMRANLPINTTTYTNLPINNTKRQFSM